MLRGGAARGAKRCAQDHGHFELAAGHVVNLRRLIDHLVHRQRNEVAEHDVDDRPHAGHRRADTDTGDPRFGNRRVDHALGAEFFYQSRQNFERRARLGDIFADDEHRRIAAHLFGERFVDRLAEGDFARPKLLAVLTSVDMLIDFTRFRIRRIEREVYGVFDFRGDFVFDALE